MARVRDGAKKLGYLLKRKEAICHDCGSPLAIEGDGSSESPANRITLDHVVPRSMGGSDHIENLVLCCEGSNQWKGARTYENQGVRCCAQFAKIAKEEARKIAIPTEVARRVAKFREKLRRGGFRRR